MLRLFLTSREQKKENKKCPEPESNQRHEDFQSSALPTELSGRNGYLVLCGLKVCLSLFFSPKCSAQDLRSFAYGIRRIHLKIYLLKNMQACF